MNHRHLLHTAVKPLSGAGSQRGLQLTLRGIVQGVGMRPFVYRLAREHGLSGDVSNCGGEVQIRLWGEQSETFITRLREQLPAGALLTALTREPLDDPAPAGFRILPSPETRARAGAMPDRATCADCLAEVLDADDRRHDYPFTNCTACGPRYSILAALPWDRDNTAMRRFLLCPACTDEYTDPSNRRFHAEPNACPDCGPQLSLRMAGEDRASGTTALDTLAAAITRGDVVAIQGLGCFHLACDARNDSAVRRLRELKNRPRKALALMARDCAQVRQFAALDAREQACLESAAAPIVLLRRASQSLPASIAPGLNRLGIMLPNSPLHHLLMRRLSGPIVLTSANGSGGLPALEATDLGAILGSAIDGVLCHDRPILRRADDSVVQCTARGPVLLRRARGYAPAPLPLPPGFSATPRVLALGAHLKNTLCLLDADGITLSPWIGDLDSTALREDHRRQRAAFSALYHFEPQVLVHDLHPDYFTTIETERLVRNGSATAMAVGHHHAHAAACLADNGRPLSAPPIGCLVLDGSGLGDDSSIWGCELLLADYRVCKALARLEPFPLPGGDQAAREPWRCLWSQLAHNLGWQRVQEEYGELPLIQALSAKPVAQLQQLCDTGTQCPPSSSAGRLFDAVAAALGIDCNDYEGEAAMRLQALAESSDDHRAYPLALRHSAGFSVINTAPLWRALLDDLACGVDATHIARRFHQGFGRALADLGQCRFAETPAWTEPLIALSGGVFQNSLLLEVCCKALGDRGFTVLTHREVPPNDSGLALGQAVVAAAQSNDCGPGRDPLCA